MSMTFLLVNSLVIFFTICVFLWAKYALSWSATPTLQTAPFSGSPHYSFSARRAICRGKPTNLTFTSPSPSKKNAEASPIILRTFKFETPLPAKDEDEVFSLLAPPSRNTSRMATPTPVLMELDSGRSSSPPPRTVAREPTSYVPLCRILEMDLTALPSLNTQLRGLAPSNAAISRRPTLSAQADSAATSRMPFVTSAESIASLSSDTSSEVPFPSPSRAPPKPSLAEPSIDSADVANTYIRRIKKPDTT
ncbi:hypothetical protein NM688_g1758 [Phlebia brevispora]|uniref:Uncharacterized protein n=1 Tax=Phlebia brevispora TaxID=194682 RepID=A0ACC1TAE6_9APHY|nr:hypothetical protein NM688_g1758 [Phlebia brevispora]